MLLKYTKAQAKQMIAERNVPELAKAELLDQFQRNGDPDGTIYQQLCCIDLCYTTLLIAIDNEAD